MSFEGQVQMKKFFLTLLLLFAVILTGCHNQQAASMKVVDNSGTIEVKAGETFVIKLESNPTTGYSWSLAEYDSKVTKQESNVYEPTKTAANVVGSGGTEVWAFKAITKGETKLTFQYTRPWEKDVPPINKETYKITVE